MNNKDHLVGQLTIPKPSKKNTKTITNGINNDNNIYKSYKKREKVQQKVMKYNFARVNTTF